MTAQRPTPSQTVGPFFHGGLLREGINVLATPSTGGARIRIEGGVYDGAHQPVPDAIVEIWQADAEGCYRHPGDRRSIASRQTFIGFGRSGTGQDGGYWFETIKPGPVPATGGGLHAPHISVAVFARGLLDHLVTRLYFADEDANRSDPTLRRIPEERRTTLLARRAPGDGAARYRFDIVLQGAGETVFFEM